MSRVLVLVRDAMPLLVIGLVCVIVACITWSSETWKLELDEESAYSHIRVRRKGEQRTLFFVRDNGREVTESRVDLEAPHRLQLPYTRVMFASYLLAPRPARVLIIGLGGGSMVHFLRHHEPDLRIDVVEIDPAVVRIADRFFGVRTGGNVRIITEDAFEYFDRSTEHYDVIYMDAFLKPSPDTDAAGVPRRMRTIAFYRQIQDRLTSEGVVAFNLMPHSESDEDVRTIELAFPGTLVFRCSPARNLVLITPVPDKPIDDQTLARRALALDSRFDVDFSFQRILADQLE